MLVLKIIAVMLGIAFTVFGYLIYFRKKYHLINGFEKDFQAGKKTERYATTVGLIEFVIGVACLLTGILLILFA